MKHSLKILTLAGALLACFTAFADDEVSPVIEKIKGNPFTGITKMEGLKGKGNALQIDGNHLYYGASDNLYVLDISQPRNPKVLGQVKLMGLIRQIAVQNGVAYVACRESGAWIVDVKNPSSPSIITRYDAVELSTGIDVAGDVLFIGQRQNGVEFVDVSDPAHPEHIFLQKTSESQSLFYKDGVLYSGDWGMGEITVIDAHDMSSIGIKKIAKLNGNGDGVFVNGNYLYAATGHHSKEKNKTSEEKFGMGHGMEIFDVSDPTNPVFISRTQFPKYYYRGNDYWTPRPNADNSICFVADTYNGLYAVNTKKPANPSIIGRIRFEKGADAKPSFVSSIAVADGVVYVSCYESGLYVVQCPGASYCKVEKGRLPENVSFRHDYKTAPDSHFTAWKPEKRAMVRGVATNGDVIYAACTDAGLAILKQGVDGNLVKIGAGKASYASDVKVRNGRLYVSEGLDGLGIYDIKGDTVLEEVARVKDFGRGTTMSIWVWPVNDDYIVTSARHSGYIFLDAKKFPEIKPVFSVSGAPGYDKYITYQATRGNLVAYNCHKTMVKWIDLNGPKPFVKYQDKLNSASLESGVSNYKDGNVITIIDNELKVLEPGVEYTEKVSGSKGDFRGMPMWDGGNLLSINARIGKYIQLVDVTDDDNPSVIFKEKTEGMPEVPVFWKGKLLVPCGYQGLLLQK